MSFVKIVVSVLMIAVLSGCATGAKSRNMIYTGRISRSFNKALLNAVNVIEVTGGRETEANGTSEIADEAFSDALIESLKEHGLFSDYGKFQLFARIVKVRNPPGDFDLKVEMHVKYTLLDATRDKVILKETIVSDYTAVSTDALMTVKRLRLAKEGAGRSNIAHLLVRLSEL